MRDAKNLPRQLFAHCVERLIFQERGARMRFFSKQARQIGLIAWALLTAQCATAAEDAEYVTKSGQPLCRTADDLKAYMQAAMLNDKTEWDCELLRAGLRLQIEEVVGRSEDLGVAIIKARVEKGGGGSSIGYTMLMVDAR